MVHLTGCALPEFTQNSEASSSTLFDDFRHINSLGDHRLRHHAPPSDEALGQHTPSPRRSRSSQTIRGPKPLLPRSLKEALQLAELLSKSKLIPKGFETPETCLVGILYGMEVGLSPIAALQRMAVIDGRPTIWGDAALALVQASGLLQSIKEELIEGVAVNAGTPLASAITNGTDVSTSTSDPTSTSSSNSTTTVQHSILTAICTVRREGRSEPITGTFSIEDAKRAGLWLKPGPWTDYPKRMLIMRARAFALRDAFPDVLAGLYIREEFEGSERRQSRLPQDQPKSEEADWHSFDIRRDFGKTNPNISSSHNALSFLNSDIGSENAQSKGPSLVGDPQNEAPRPSRPQQQQTVDPRRAPPPPPPPPESSHHVEMAEPESGVQSNPTGSIVEPLNRVTTAVDEQSHSTAEERLDPETLLDLFDSALCCALDLPTLEEIVDDFAGRLKSVPKDDQRRAQKIIERHQKRVHDLDHIRQPQAEDRQPYASRRNAKLPRGLASLLPSLGIGRKLTTRRIETRGNRLARSLASWNARQPLTHPNMMIEDREELPFQDHTPEVSE